MGSVYLAQDLKLDIKVALKMPRPEILGHPKLRERFYREARAAARLVHPGLCWVIDVGQVEDTHYLVMRYVSGTPLSRYRNLNHVEAAMLVRNIARAMAAAHREGVVHRDLKPSNIIVTPEGEPVVIDFGLALLIDDDPTRVTEPGVRLGTPRFMPPEQLLGVPEEIGPRSDIYSLGCVLYKLLTGQHPFESSIEQLVFGPPLHLPAPPSAHRPYVHPALDSICLKAIARDADERYQSMAELAAYLEGFLKEHIEQSNVAVPAQTPLAVQTPSLSAWPLTVSVTGRMPSWVGKERCSVVRREAIRFAFAASGSSTPKAGIGSDRLFLGVGNDLRVGVLDHHHLHSYGGSTAGLVVSNPRFVTEAVTSNRDPDTPFTIVLAESPDFDSVAAAYLAVSLLTEGELPPGAEPLARYAEKIDQGSIGHSLSNPFSPYGCYMQLLNRETRSGRPTDHELWLVCVQQGLVIIAGSLDRVLQDGVALPSVDAFAGAGMFGDIDREEVLADIERYKRKLADPATKTRVVRLRLPGQFGGQVDIDALLARDVQNADDPNRCVFFKDWARSDRDGSPGREGFVALSIFVSESKHEVRHCVLSVTPDSGASLRGLADLLDGAESQHRRRVYGEDDRAVDPVTGLPKPARAGYVNADPWYDGRAHGFTIVDSPWSGTLLSADEIEEVLLRFGQIGEL
jgi:serine/threonine protein kinase